MSNETEEQQGYNSHSSSSCKLILKYKFLFLKSYKGIGNKQKISFAGTNES